MTIPTIAPTLALLFFLTCAVPSESGELCSEAFHLPVGLRNLTHCKRLGTLDAKLGWHVSRFNSQWTRIDVVVGAKVLPETGWLAWGVNPLPKAQMVGTRAIIGIRQPNGSLSINTYNVTSDTKIGCRLLSSAVDIEVWNMTPSYIQETHYLTLSAAVIIPDSKYNASRLNHVWQVGHEADEEEPKMHRKTLQNFDSTATLNMWTAEFKGTSSRHHQTYLRKVHGILNILGWGTFLPIGVIVARYFRKHPFYCKDWWYYLHVACQIIGYSLGTAGWVIGLVLGANSSHYTFRIHRLMAIFIFVFTTLQMLALRLRPGANDEYRTYWNMYHHFLGYALLAVIILNIFHGIAILKPDDAVWSWVYIGILVLLSAVALLFEIYSWAKFIDERRKSKRNKENKFKNRTRGDAASHRTSQAAN